MFFTGWSTDSQILEDIEIPKGYDLMVLWDYRDMSCSVPTERYDEILIIAWSFGIPVATITAVELLKQHNITGMYAVSGSWKPVDNEYGIPENIFNRTLETLNEQNLRKFRVRMSGGISNFNLSAHKFPNLPDIDALKEELRVFDETINDIVERISYSRLWDYVFIACNDKIFPAENLKRAWKGIPVETIDDGEHLPDFQYIIDRTVKNKEFIGQRFGHHLQQYEESADVQKRIARELVDEWNKHQTTAGVILEIGSGSGYLTRLINSTFSPQELTVIDLQPSDDGGQTRSLAGDAETILPGLQAESFDAVATGSTLQWFHSPQRFMSNLHRIIKKGGYAAIAVFIKGTFEELDGISDKKLLYLSHNEWKELALNQGFFVISESESKAEMEFESYGDMLRHLQQTGVNSVSGRQKSVGEIRRLLSADSNKCLLTYRWTTLILRK